MPTAIATSPRLATSADVLPLTRMLGRAFFEDPMAKWACRSPVLRPRILEGMHGARLRQLLADGEIWTMPDCSSAALWAPPGWQSEVRQDAQLAKRFLHPQLLTRLPLLALGLNRIQRKHPHNPQHWYLLLLGTLPAAQGKGLGSAVLQPVLERCDRTAHGAYVETSVPENLGFYSRHGFQVTGMLKLPRGPRVWTMWREPRTDRRKPSV